MRARVRPGDVVILPLVARGDFGTERLKRAVFDAGRTAIRTYGQATARWRPNPDFLIIGTKRGGTTSIYFDLLGHSHVVPLFPRPDRLPKATATKGIHYFDQNFQRGERWYRSHLPSTFARARAERRVGAPVITGEASPYYLFHPAAAERAQELVPEAKLILLLRDPVMRTYSHWKERRRSDTEPLGFLEALDAEDARLAGAAGLLRGDPAATSYAHEQQSYARQSEYDVSLAVWLQHFPRHQFLVLASENYYREPAATLARVQDFLGLPPESIASGTVRNAAAGEDLEPAVRDRLAARFAPHNENLERLTGEKFPWM